MKAHKSSLFADIPKQLPAELCQNLLTSPNIRIERIISKGHASPTDFWYDQAENEWVLLVAGQARLAFADGSYLTLNSGDYTLLPAHCRHRVDWTCPDTDTVWLALFFSEGATNAA
jgi:cupin 2 domain-containing protein